MASIDGDLEMIPKGNSLKASFDVLGSRLKKITKLRKEYGPRAMLKAAEDEFGYKLTLKDIM